MSKFALVIGTAAVLSLATLAAPAQQRGVGSDPVSDGRFSPPAERSLMLFGFNGTMKMMKATDKGHTEIMKHARPLGDGVGIYRSGGKFYLIENKKMASGKMLFDEMAGLMVEDRQLVGGR